MKYIKLFEQYGEDWDEKLLDYSWNGNLNSVKQSIKNGADVNCKTNHGWTPLHRSTYRNHLDIVKYLIEHGVDVNCKDNDGWTPLHRSTYWNHLYVVKYLIEHGVDVNCKTNHGWTPLLLSSYCDNLNIIKYLIEHGAEWFIKDNYNKYFMDYLSHKNKNIIKKLYPDKYKEYEMRIEMDKYNL